MVTIVENDKLVDQFMDEFGMSDSIIVPVWSDRSMHPLNNELSLLYVKMLDSGREYMLPYSHTESSFRFDRDLTKNKNIKYILNKKNIIHYLDLSNVVDVNLIEYLGTGNCVDVSDVDTTAHKVLNSKYHNFKNINRLIPIHKHGYTCSRIAEKLQSVINRHSDIINTIPFKFLNETTIDSLKFIEGSGLFIDRDAFTMSFQSVPKKHITNSNIVYTDYNLYTSTGRPSNHHANVNYAALNRTNGDRQAFISRFMDGAIVMYDYDAYHLRLIADMIGYEFDTDINIHEYFGKQYFGVDGLTEDQYNDSKAISFRLLYGGIPDEFKSIPFFNMADKFIDDLWNKFNKRGFIETPISKRRITKASFTGVNPMKLMNYLLQLHETENNIMVVEGLKSVLHEYKSKLVLYTYDSFMFDFSFVDGKDFLVKVKNVMECNGKYPVKVYSGKSYHDMVEMTHKFK